ncbi:MAG: hypothetical protein LBU26_03815 [Synergistaceae bacterium]|jgi:hypothetical protein|nr:hypothetical protein [Synergistaceae bacterium]
MKLPIAILVLTVGLLPLGKTWGNIAAAADMTEPVWWSITAQTRSSDGGTMVSLDLVCPRGMKIDDADVVYVSTPRGGSPEVFRKKISIPEDLSPVQVGIYSGRYEQIDLRGRFSSGGRVYYAQTLFNCYGESGTVDKDAELIPAAPEWRTVSLAEPGGRYFYRAQAGQTITVITGVHGRPVKIFENGEQVATVESGGSGNCSYAPPHDKELARRGPSAKKDLTFEIPLPDENGFLSFSLPVYRAFYGQASLGGGISVLLAAVAVSLSFVLLMGRRFRWR